MKKLVFSYVLVIILFPFYGFGQKTSSLSKNLFKMSLGTHYFYDDYSGDIVGFNVGLHYEKIFSRKWSWGIGLESYFNKNAVPKTKLANASYVKNNGEINLPEIEERYAFSPEIRYYFTRAGQGFYLSNVSSIQRVRHGYLNYVYDCMHCPNQSFLLENFFTLSDRLTWGYQKFINQKLLVGVSIAYELRLGFDGLINSPQISCQFGFGK